MTGLAFSIVNFLCMSISCKSWVTGSGLSNAGEEEEEEEEEKGVDMSSC